MSYPQHLLSPIFKSHKEQVLSFKGTKFQSKQHEEQWVSAFTNLLQVMSYEMLLAVNHPATFPSSHPDAIKKPNFLVEVLLDPHLIRPLFDFLLAQLEDFPLYFGSTPWLHFYKGYRVRIGSPGFLVAPETLDATQEILDSLATTVRSLRVLPGVSIIGDFTYTSQGIYRHATTRTPISESLHDIYVAVNVNGNLMSQQSVHAYNYLMSFVQSNPHTPAM